MASRAARNDWMKGAVKPANKGKFSAKAKKAGKTTAAFAKEKASAPGTLGKEARLAQVFEKNRPMKKGGVVKPKGYAAGGAAKARLGMASPSGAQAKVTSPVKSQRSAPKAPKAVF